MSLSAPIPFPGEIKDNIARNSIPAGLGWYPQAPANVGTKLNGQDMSTELSSVSNLQYVDEDFASNALYGEVTQLNCAPCTGLRVPSNGVNRADHAARGAAFTQGMGRDDKGSEHGVVATAGELLFTHRRAAQTLSKYEKLLPLNMSTYDETARETEAITVPWLNRYLAGFHDLAANWTTADLVALVDSLRFMGVVDHVGPGQSRVTDRNHKSYIIIYQRMAQCVIDIWTHSEDDQKNHGRGFGRNPAGLLYLELHATPVNPGNPDNVTYTDPRIVPFSTRDHGIATRRVNTEFQNRLAPFVGTRKILYSWYVGMYHSLTHGGPKQREPRVEEYLGLAVRDQNGAPVPNPVANPFAKKEIAQCKVLVGL